MIRFLKLFFLLMALAFFAVPNAHAGTHVIFASTTSARDSGLLDVLLPAYYNWTKLRNVTIDVVAVGTGKAIDTAKRGDADLLLVHDRQKEDAFIKDGYGVNRKDVMYNDFVVVGPPDDPAKIMFSLSAQAAFRKIASSGSMFVSRGDESGTHEREKWLWKTGGVDMLTLRNYLSAGQGMAATLRIADERGAYTLSDRATYSVVKDSLKGITLLYDGDPALFNQYGAMAVNPKKFPNAHYKEAMDFIDFITSPEGQQVIGNFQDKHGNTLFVPNANQ